MNKETKEKEKSHLYTPSCLIPCPTFNQKERERVGQSSTFRAYLVKKKATKLSSKQKSATFPN